MNCVSIKRKELHKNLGVVAHNRSLRQRDFQDLKASMGNRRSQNEKQNLNMYINNTGRLLSVSE